MLSVHGILPRPQFIAQLFDDIRVVSGKIFPFSHVRVQIVEFDTISRVVFQQLPCTAARAIAEKSAKNIVFREGKRARLVIVLVEARQTAS